MPFPVTVPIEAEYMLENQNWSEYHLLSKIYCNGREIPCQEIKEESNLNLDWRKKIVFSGTLEPMTVTRFSVYNEKVKGFRPFDKESVPAEIDSFLNGTPFSHSAELELYDDTADPWGMSEAELKNGMGKNPVPFRLMTDEECGAFIVSDEKISAVHKIEEGEVLSAVECFYKCRNTNAVIEYKRYKFYDYIVLKVTVEFYEKNKLVKLKILCYEKNG